MKTDRRGFIKTCGTLATGLMCGGGSLLLNSCASANYLNFRESQNTLIVAKSHFLTAPFGLIQHVEMRAPIFINKVAEDQFTAVLLECPHRGCTVSPVGDLLVCPCHGSEFRKTGELLSPPAEENLVAFKTHTDNENVVITIG